MKNKTLATWSLGMTTAMFIGFLSDMPTSDSALWGFLCVAYFVFTIWASIRLLKIDEVR